MQEIVGALENFSMVVVADKDIAKSLTEAVELLTWNNLSLTA